MTKLRKLIASSLLIALVLALNSIGASAEWRQDNTGWWYSEGNSYVKNQWKQINGKWYYFDYLGYMIKNEIVHGYYLDSNGNWSTGTQEIQAYEKLLNNPILLKEKYGILDISKIEILDIDNDGIYEVLVYSGNCNANSGASVFTYKNGDIQFSGRLGDWTYYCEEQKVLLGSKTFTGVTGGGVYKLENGKLNEIHSFEIVINSNASYSIDGKYVTKEQSNNFFKQYGATNWVIE